MVFQKLRRRIRRAIELSKEPEEVSTEKLKALLAEEPLGDGKAEFLGEGSQDEFAEQEKEDRGHKGIFGT